MDHCRVSAEGNIRHAVQHGMTVSGWVLEGWGGRGGVIPSETNKHAHCGKLLPATTTHVLSKKRGTETLTCDPGMSG
jgi:hypothetical protein